MATMKAVGFPDTTSATRDARKYITDEQPDFTLADVTTFYDDKDTLSWGWVATWGDDESEGEPVPEGEQEPASEPASVPGWDEADTSVESDPAPVAPEVAEAFGELVVIDGGKVDDVPVAEEGPRPGDVFLRISGAMPRTAASMLANMIAGKLAGVTLEMVDVVSGNVVQTFEGKSARKAGTPKGVSAPRDARDWTIKPIITGTNAGAQSRLDRIESARFNAKALRAELDKISPTSVQTYSVQARKYAEALLAEAEAEDDKYGGPMDHLLAAD